MRALKIKILLCTNSHLPNVGGRELVVHHLAQQFVKKGHKVFVAGPLGFWTNRKEEFVYPVMRWPKVPVVSPDVSQIIMLGITRAVTGVDILHAHATYPAAYVAKKTKWVRPAPLVVTPHGEDINIVPEIGFGQRLDPDQDKKIQEALSFCSRVTSISNTITESLASIGVPDNKITYIPNGVDLERFNRPIDTDVLSYLGFPPDSWLLSSIGNYHPRKGHEVLLKSMSILIEKDPRFRLVIIGAKSEELSRQIANSPLNEYVVFLGSLGFVKPSSGQHSQHLDKTDLLSAILQASKAYISASINEGAEGLSLALLESMAAGCCPVVTRISGNRDIIEHGRNGVLVNPNDPIDLAEALTKLKTSPEKRSKMAETARKDTSTYGWSAIADRYLEVYREVIEKQRLIRQ